MYQLAHYIIKHFPFVWTIAEFFNEKLFLIRYGRRLKHLGNCLENYQGVYLIKEATLEDVPSMVTFFAKQPKESYTYFQPHGFDEKTLLKLVRRRSFLMFLVMNGEEIVGYFFLRCFANGNAFKGRLVDYQWRNQGIAKLMGSVINEIVFSLNLRLFTTISPDNYASLASTKAVNNIRIVRVLKNGYYYIECTPKKKED